MRVLRQAQGKCSFLHESSGYHRLNAVTMSSQVALQNKDTCIGELNLRLANIQTLLQVGKLAVSTFYFSI